MKARIKHTDTIIDVVREPLGWQWNSIQGKVYLDKEELEFLDSDDNIDWQSFRAEAAKNILCSIIQGGYAESRIEYQSKLAVKYADEFKTKWNNRVNHEHNTTKTD